MSGSVAVATFRLRTAAQDTTALRLRAARELQAADLTPPGLPPSAVLIVRRVVDPMPGRFGAGRPRPRLEWERAVRLALSDAAHAAARPDGRGRIPSTAQAVLFDDEAELVACLIGDMVRGEMASRWWYRSVQARLGARASVASGSRDPSPILCERPREAPAALALLTRWGEARAAAACITPDGAVAVLRALGAAHGLEIRLPVRTEATDRDARVDLQPASIDGGATDDTHSTPRIAAPGRRAIWLAWLPGALDDDRIAPEVQCLFGVALGLHASPARIRADAVLVPGRHPTRDAVAPVTGDGAYDGAYGGASRRRMADAPVAPRDGTAGAAAGAASNADSDAASDASGVRRARTTAEHAEPAAREDHPSDARDARHATPGWRAGVEATRHDGQPSQDAGSGEQRDTPPAVSTDPHPAWHVTPGADASALGQPSTSPARRETSIDPAPAAGGSILQACPGEGLPTRLGGLLYLIHALEHLALPDVFEPAWRLSTIAGPWGTLDLVGRALLGQAFASVAADPMWLVLAELADWPATHPRGADPSYRIPAAWLAHLDDPGDRFTWSVRDRRLWIWSRAGYLVAHRAYRGGDAPSATTRAEAVAVVRRELARLRPGDETPLHLVHGDTAAIPSLPPLARPAGCPPRLARLAAALAPAIRRRLCLALGLDPRTRVSSRRDPVRQLLSVPGQLHVSSSHVDFVAGLDRIDLAVRRAGLDRDPGWLPSYGRVVYLHFT